jgi:hypothetical protein
MRPLGVKFFGCLRRTIRHEGSRGAISRGKKRRLLEMLMESVDK